MARYFFIDSSGNVRDQDTPPIVYAGSIVGAANGVDLTNVRSIAAPAGVDLLIEGGAGSAGTYTSAGNITIRGGTAGIGTYNLGGSVYLSGGVASGVGHTNGSGGAVSSYGGAGVYNGGVAAEARGPSGIRMVGLPGTIQGISEVWHNGTVVSIGTV